MSKLLLKIVGMRSEWQIAHYIHWIGEREGGKFWRKVLRGTGYKARSMNEMMGVIISIRQQYNITE
jgi:hypothetical protein